MTLPTYYFDGFTLRPAVTEDLALAKAWTLGDPFHRDSTQPAFWVMQTPTTNSYLLEDEKGAVFFFRVDERGSTVEIHIQFTSGNAITQARTRRGMIAGFKWLEKTLLESGFEGYYFHSNSPQLVYFCQNRFNFQWDGKKLWRNVRTSDGQAKQFGT